MTWKRSFPRPFTMEYTWCVCRVAKWRQISLSQTHLVLAKKSDVTLLIMFLKKSSEMFRHTSIVSIALYTQKLCCNINKSKPRAKAFRKSLKKSLKNVFSKLTWKTKSREQNTDENGIQESSRIKSIKSKFSGISLTNLFSKIAFGKSISTQNQ